MKGSVFFREELLKKASIAEDVLDQLEKSKVISPAGTTEDKVAFYSKAHIAQLNYVKKLLDMGYGMNEIEKIVKKVGLPKTDDVDVKGQVSKKYLTVGGLAESIGVSARTIKHWEEKGIIEADMRSEGGFRLYSDIYIYLCNLIKDVQLFGYSLEQIKTISDLFRLFLEIKKDIEGFTAAETEQCLKSMLAEIETLKDRMSLLKAGIERWDELVNKKSKEIVSLQKENQKRKKIEAKP
jgi:DNA-binding transcriptional MerR regulator